MPWSGGGAEFKVSIIGATPLHYQWRWKQTVIPGATNASVYFANLTTANMGTIDVVVTNNYGSITSQGAHLSVATYAIWGDDRCGQSAPADTKASPVSAVLGWYHDAALYGDGTVKAWGDNSLGQTNVTAGLSNVIGIAAGSYHNLAILADGTVTGWGDNRYLQLNVPSGLNNVVKVVCGDSHGLALRKDGSITCWGHNQWLQTEAPAGLTGVKDIAAGGDHSFVILAQP